MMVANVILAVIEHRQERERRRSAIRTCLVRARQCDGWSTVQGE